MFNEPAISDYYRRANEDVRSAVLRESEEQILGSDADELAQYYFDQYAFVPLEEDPEREASFDIQDYLQDVPAHRREGFYSQAGDLRDFSCQRAVIEIPLKQNRHWSTIAKLHGSQFFMDGSEGRMQWREDVVSTTIETKGYGFEFDQEKIGGEVNRTFGQMREIIRFKNTSIQQENPGFLQNIKNLINERKQKLLQNKEKMAALTKTVSIPLKKKTSSGAQIVRVAPAPFVQRVKPRATPPEQYQLDEAKVRDIIGFLDNQARSFEKTPETYKGLGEEDLRNILLSMLNAVFEGSATGETFSKSGKTDIHLNIAKGDILICECKIWGGKALCGETIDQLRGYLTWRHNYGIVITFVRNKDFTKTLQESEAAIQVHSSYLRGFKKINDTHFVSNHKIDDDEKEVEIHHLFYHLYTK